MTDLIDKAEARDDDLIRRGDADAVVLLGGSPVGMSERIRALPARGVVVKPLVWEPHWTGGEEAREFAQVPIGMDYHVNDNGWWQTLSPLYRCVNREAAKAAAQADYEARILATLTDASASQPTVHVPEESIATLQARLTAAEATVEKLRTERDDALIFLDNAVSKAPESLKALGKYLAERLDDDEWPTAEQHLNAAAKASQAAEVKVEKLSDALRLIDRTTDDSLARRIAHAALAT